MKLRSYLNTSVVDTFKLTLSALIEQQASARQKENEIIEQLLTASEAATQASFGVQQVLVLKNQLEDLQAKLTDPAVIVPVKDMLRSTGRLFKRLEDSQSELRTNILTKKAPVDEGLKELQKDFLDTKRLFVERVTAMEGAQEAKNRITGSNISSLIGMMKETTLNVEGTLEEVALRQLRLSQDVRSFVDDAVFSSNKQPLIPPNADSKESTLLIYIPRDPTIKLTLLFSQVSFLGDTVKLTKDERDVLNDEYTVTLQVLKDKFLDDIVQFNTSSALALAASESSIDASLHSSFTRSNMRLQTFDSDVKVAFNSTFVQTESVLNASLTQCMSDLNSKVKLNKERILRKRDTLDAVLDDIIISSEKIKLQVDRVDGDIEKRAESILDETRILTKLKGAFKRLTGRMRGLEMREGEVWL